MFIGAIAFTGVLGVGLHWFLTHTRFDGDEPKENTNNETETKE